MKDGGYEDGYRHCDRFWGTHPAEYVVFAMQHLTNIHDRRALDLGCGEGKNALAMSSGGFEVTAIDVSQTALAHARSTPGAERVIWKSEDLRAFRTRTLFDLVIATGSLHCLDSPAEVEDALANIRAFTKPGGLTVVYSFNDGPHDFTGHQTDFEPVLLSHAYYLSAFQGWRILRESDQVQLDVHPNNNIQHSHAISRIVAQKPVAARAD
jgi:2-polyprenyl-3-methyl-5-hydroxy-6-metoxy-1,4-benzoquinol methylase